MIPSDQQSEKCAKIDMFRSAIWTLQGMLPSPLTHAVMAAGFDDLNPYSISRVMCSRPSLQTWTSWLQYITNVTPLIWLSIYHHVTLSNTPTSNHNPKPKPNPNTNHSPNPNAIIIINPTALRIALVTSRKSVYTGSDTFRLAIWQSWTKVDTFRSVIWKVCKNW